MYVEWAGAAESAGPPVAHPHPRRRGQGLDWLGTPDGRPGWAPELARRGHRVYTVDRPGHGRGAQWAGALGEMAEPLPTPRPSPSCFARLTASTPPRICRRSGRATDGAPGSDPAILQWSASCRSMPTDLSVAHTLERQLGAELIDRVGPSVLFTHSAGGPPAG